MSRVVLQNFNSGSPGSGCYAPARPSSAAPSPDGPGARRSARPQDEMNAGRPLHPPEVHPDPPAAAGAAHRPGHRSGSAPRHGGRAGRAGEHPGHLEEVDGMAWTRAGRRWAWALALVLGALALAVPLTVA